MLERLTKWLYRLVTECGLVFKLLPVFLPVIRRLALKSPTDACKLCDPGGASMNVTKLNGRIYPAFQDARLANIRRVPIRNDDVMLCGYPKSGCHWVYEILTMLLTGRAEMTKYGKFFGGMIDAMPFFLLDSLPSPRVLNSHVLYEELPVQLKERRTKIVWTVRSPKDTVVSFYNHTQALRAMYEYEGMFENFFQLFISGQVEYGSYFDFVLSWDEAVRTQTDNPILVVEYEKLKLDTVATVREMARFLEVSVTDRFVREVVSASHFKQMKARRSGDRLFRKGQVGDWRNWLTPSQSAQIDRMWKDRMSHCFYQPDLR